MSHLPPPRGPPNYTLCRDRRPNRPEDAQRPPTAMFPPQRPLSSVESLRGCHRPSLAVGKGFRPRHASFYHVSPPVIHIKDLDRSTRPSAAFYRCDSHKPHTRGAPCLGGALSWRRPVLARRGRVGVSPCLGVPSRPRRLTPCSTAANRRAWRPVVSYGYKPSSTAHGSVVRHRAV